MAARPTCAQSHFGLRQYTHCPSHSVSASSPAMPASKPDRCTCTHTKHLCRLVKHRLCLLQRHPERQLPAFATGVACMQSPRHGWTGCFCVYSTATGTYAEAVAKTFTAIPLPHLPPRVALHPAPASANPARVSPHCRWLPSPLASPGPPPQHAPCLGRRSSELAVASHTACGCMEHKMSCTLIRPGGLAGKHY